MAKTHHGKPCHRCGGTLRYKDRDCVRCKKERNRKWRNDNKTPREYWDKWRNDNPEYYRKWYKDNVECVSARYREWAKGHLDNKKANSHRYLARKLKSGGSFTKDEWNELCVKYDNRCLACNKKTKLEADHVIPVSKGGTSDISNIQPLCKSCNCSKWVKHIDYR